MSELIELTVNECRDLLSGGVVGRIALATPVGPRIVPVNYAMHGDSIVFRTSPYSELATYGRPGTEAAFEIDHLEYESQKGWSVMALGRLRVMDSEEVQELRKTWDPRPWAGGARNLYLQLEWRELSGRRLGSGWKASSMMPVRRILASSFGLGD